jgi:hypothetical protein
MENNLEKVRRMPRYDEFMEQFEPMVKNQS